MCHSVRFLAGVCSFAKSLPAGLLVSAAMSVAASGEVGSLYSFGLPLAAQPGPFLQAPDGSFYGTAGVGGKRGFGALIRVEGQGTESRTLLEFGSIFTNVSFLPGPLVALVDGVIYGEATDFPESGLTNFLYRVGIDGSGFTRLHGLPPVHGSLFRGSEGAFYVGSLSGLTRIDPDGGSSTTVGLDAQLSRFFEGSDGKLHGVAVVPGVGVSLFEMRTDGTHFVPTLTSLNPIVALIEGGDHRLYGVRQEHFFGLSFFSTDLAGGDLRELGMASSGGQDAAIGSFQEGGDGSLYALFSTGPLSPAFTILAIAKSGGVTPVLTLPPLFPTNGGPLPTLLACSDGLLYGSSSLGGRLGGGFFFSVGRDGTGFRELLDFGGLSGSFVQSALVLGTDGLLYGTSRQGGVGDRGMVFSLRPGDGAFTVLKQFGGSAEGSSPRGGVVEGIDGVLYGTTATGGSADGGTLFRLNKDGSGFALLKSFTSSTGTNPVTQLLRARDGALYGTCISGGTTATNGSIWKYDPSGGGFSLLKLFPAGGGDGRRPFAPLTEGADGNLYGVTEQGGAANKGVIFTINPFGEGFKVLRSLTGFGDAATPDGQLLQLADGVLIGTSSAGGTAGLGSIFVIRTNGSGYQVVHSFLSSGGDGRTPLGGLVPAGDGSLLGTTRFGGGEAVGTVFRIQPDGSGYGIVARFSKSGASPQEPWAGLVSGNSPGLFYGASTLGGEASGGAVFQLSLDLPAGPLRLGIELLTDGTLRLQVPPAGSGYRLERLVDLLNPAGWETVLASVPSGGGPIPITLDASTPTLFFRLVKP
ncbi:MAG TPA: hypothetical protein DCM86_13235 [Verrucomicrobiales bacterium]|nr:hypothetical protein [Verrucomicrobiales bacterium]